MPQERKPYASDVTDAEWEFCAPYLTLMDEKAPQREYPLRAVFDALRYFVRAGCPWRMMPHDLPPWRVVYEQTKRWNQAGCLEAMAHDLRCLARLAAKRHAQPTAVVIDSRTLQSTPESGERAGYDGYKRRKGSKVHIAVDTLGHLLALKTTPPMNRIARRLAHWRNSSRKSPERTSSWPLSTKDTPESTPPSRRWLTASNSTW